MPYLSKSELNRLTGQNYKSASFSEKTSNARNIEKVLGTTKYDIFLSHSYLDRETVFQINYLLEETLGLSVFVDWIENPELARDDVTLKTASLLRDAMNRSASLVYAISVNSSESKWMPWELGYSDAKHGRVAVLPIADYTATTTAYKTQEFVGLYPYITIDDARNGNRYLYVNDPQNANRYANFAQWIKNGNMEVHS